MLLVDEGICVRVCVGHRRRSGSLPPQSMTLKWSAGIALPSAPAARGARAAMALSKLSGDEQGVIFVQLCNVLDPGYGY